MLANVAECTRGAEKRGVDFRRAPRYARRMQHTPNEKDIARFFAKVKVEDDPHPEFGTPCHMWTAAKTACGHGLIGWGFRDAPPNSGRARVMRRVYAHRVALELAGRKPPPYVPGGPEVSHKCHRAGCVNPDHLELLTPAQHQLEPDSGAQVAARKKQAMTHCKYGHPFDGNTKIVNGNRRCAICLTERERRRAQSRTPEQRSERARYMREYRKRKRAEAETPARDNQC